MDFQTYEFSSFDVLALKDSAKLLSLKLGPTYIPTEIMIPHVSYGWKVKTLYLPEV